MGSLAREDVPRCGPDELVSAVATRVEAAGDWEICVVTTEEGVVVGVLGRHVLAAGRSVRAEEAMTEGPSTLRPSARLDEAARRMRDEGLTRIVVTRSNGILVGALRRDDVEARSMAAAS